MATRSRGASGRRSKSSSSPPAVAGAVLEDENRSGSFSEASGENEDRSMSHTQYSTPTVTRATLERREIPSFSESREARIAEAAYWRDKDAVDS